MTARGGRFVRLEDVPFESERGGASLLAIALCVALMMTSGAIIPLAAALSISQRADGAADSAALAAADVTSGLVPGAPCSVAALVVAANNAEMTFCEVDEMIATVEVRVRVGVIPVSARATAGPPSDGDR